MQWLKQSTAVTLKIGPFLDDTDGKTAETGLTIAQADVRLSKNGGDIAQKNESTSCTHDELGIYGCPVDATDTGTLGRLQLFVHESGALPVWHEFMVIPANEYDSLVSGSDALEVHAVEITAGLITAAAVATGAIDADALATDAVAAIADGVWDELATGHVSAGKAGEQLWTDLDAVLADTNELQTDDVPGLIGALNDLSAAQVNAEVDTALADLDLDHLIEVSAGAEQPTDGSYIDLMMHKSGGQTFDAATDSLEAIRDNMAGADVAAIADGVWDEAIADHAGAGSTGEALAGATAPSAAAVADQVWDELRAAHVITASFGAVGEWAIAALGAGTTPLEVTVTDGVNPLDGAEVDVTTTAAHTGPVASGYTDAFGKVTFHLDPGTYYIWVQHSGYNGPNPTAKVIA